MPFYIDFNNTDSDSEKEVFLAEALDRADGIYRDEPASSDAGSAVAEPAIAEPAIAEPAIAEPAIAEPAIAEPAIAEPAIDAWRKRSAAEGFARTATLIAAAAAKAANNQAVTQETARVATKRPRFEVAQPDLPQLKYLDGSNVVWQSNMIHSQREGKNYIVVTNAYTGEYICEMQVFTEQELNGRQLRIPGGRLGK